METTKILLTAAAAMLLGWSCNNDDTTPPIPQPSVEVATPAAAQEAIDGGSTTITITQPVTAGSTLSVPDGYPVGTKLTLIIPANGNDITIQESSGHGLDYPLIVLDLTQGKTVTLNTPNCSVVFTGTAATVSSTTAADTFTLTKGSTVTNLSVLKGGAKIYGTATNVTNSGAGKILLALGSGSDRPVVPDIIKSMLALTWIDGMILTEDKYALNADIAATGDEFGQNDPSYLWYLPIEKNGFRIIGDGDVRKIILYGQQQEADELWSSQNLITVFASNVTISGITLKNKLSGNKMIEVTKPGFTVSECRFVSNDEVTPEEGMTDFVGGVYFSLDADRGLVQNNYFYTGTVSTDGLMNGDFYVEGNVFDGVYDNDFVVIATTNSTAGDVSASTMTMELTGNEFINVPVYDAATMSYAVLDISYGTVTSEEDTFPTSGVYYHVYGSGTLVLDGQTITPGVD